MDPTRYGLDISWLPGPVKGLFYYLYFVMDLFSRKIVGYEVYQEEQSLHLRDVVARAVLGVASTPRILHSDNGSPMKGIHLLELCYSLGIVNTYSRPRVSNDNAHIEAVFKTVKYCPAYPYGGFASLAEARTWVYSFVDGYNHFHRHSGIKYVTPHEKHTGLDIAILANRR
jgi:putative transposase